MKYIYSIYIELTFDFEDHKEPHHKFNADIVIVDVLEGYETPTWLDTSGKQFPLKLTKAKTVVKLYDLASRIHEGI